MHVRMMLSENRSEIGVEEALKNYPALSRTTLGRWVSVGFGVATLGIAVYVARGTLGYVGGTAHAPDWVLWCVAIIFMLGGVALCSHGILDVLEKRRAAADARAHPDDPWREDYAWADAVSGRGMRSRDSRWWGMWGLALLVVVCMTLVSFWVSWTGPGGVVGVFLWVMSGFVVLALAAYAWVFIQRVIAVIRYGSPRVVYEAIPVRPGEMLTGGVLCPKGFGALDRVTIVLRWVEERYDKVPRSGGKDKTVIRCRGTASDVWVIEDVAAALGADERSGSGEIPIAFLIPEDAGETRASERPARFWDLEVRGEARGVDFVHRFVVPVYG